MEAVLSHDADQAEKLMVKHIELTSNSLIEILQAAQVQEQKAV